MRLEKPVSFPVIITNILATFAVLGIMMLLMTPFATQGAQAQYIPLPTATYDEGGLPVPQGDTAQEQVQYIALRLVDFVRFTVGAVAVLFITISALKLIMSEGDKEEYKKQIQNIVYAGVGLALIALAGEVRDIFSLENGGFLRDPNKILQQSRIFNNTTNLLIVFIKYIVGSFCVLSIVSTGLRLVTQSSEEDELSTDKKNMFYSFLGLFIIMISDTVVNRVFFKVRDKFPGTGGVDVFPDTSEGVKLIAGTTNTLVSFAGPIAILVLLGAGFVYITAGGEEQQQETAKRMIFYSIVGLLLIYGAYAIVTTFILGNFG
jgi:hypothetical protein